MKFGSNYTPKPKASKIDNTQLLKDTGLKIRHFHTIDRYGYSRPRNLTVAFKEGRSTLEIATAITHPSDCFSRKMGTKLACEAFQQGKVVRVPKAIDFEMGWTKGKPSFASAQRTLALMFG